MKQVMVRAWEIAREAVKKFGGKVKEFFQQALIIAWSEIKNNAKMVELKGSEKQVAWADDIRKNVIELCNQAIEIKKEKLAKRSSTEEIEKRMTKPLQFVEMLKTNESAKWFIENFKFLSQNKYDSYSFEVTMKEMHEAKALNMDVVVQGFARTIDEKITEAKLAK